MALLRKNNIFKIVIIFIIIVIFVYLYNINLKIESFNISEILINKEPENRIISNHGEESINLISDKSQYISEKILNSSNGITIYPQFKDDSIQYFNPLNTVEFTMNIPTSEADELNLFYNSSLHELEFRTKNISFTINDQIYKSEGVIKHKIQNINQNEILQIGEKYYTITDDNDIGKISEKYLVQNKILRINKKGPNLLSGNTNFDNGFWQPNVDKCSTSETENNSEQKILNQNENNVLELYANNVITCTHNRFIINKSFTKFLFTLKYNNSEGGTGAYNLKYSNRNETKKYDQIGNIIYETDSQTTIDNLYGQSTKLIDYSKVINTTLPLPYFYDLFIYSNGTTQESRTIFDDFGIYEIEDSQELKLSTTDNYVENIKVLLPHGSSTIQFKDNQNLLSKYDVGFEKGSWQLAPYDCSSNVEDEPNFRQEIVPGYQSEKALRLESDNHFACVYNKFYGVFPENVFYELNFNYRINNGDNGLVLVRVHSKEDIEYFEDINIQLEKVNKDWQSIKYPLHSDIKNISYIELYLYAPSLGSLYSIDYDNFSLIKFSPMNFEDYTLSYKNSNKIISDATIATSENSLIIQKYKINKIDGTYLQTKGDHTEELGLNAIYFKKDNITIFPSDKQNLILYKFKNSYLLSAVCLVLLFSLIINFEKIVKLTSKFIPKSIKKYFSDVVILSFSIIITLFTAYYFNPILGLAFAIIAFRKLSTRQFKFTTFLEITSLILTIFFILNGNNNYSELTCTIFFALLIVRSISSISFNEFESIKANVI